MNIHTWFRLALVLVLSTLGVSSFQPLAHADAPPSESQLFVYTSGAPQNPNESTVTGFFVGFADVDGGDAEVGTTVKLEVYSCGAFIASDTDTAEKRRKMGSFFNFTSSQQRRIGRSIDYVATITQPGYDSYRRTGSYSGYNVRRPSCEELQDPLRVTWSEKRGVAKVGRSVSVTPTVAPGASVTYTWQLRRPSGTCRAPACNLPRNVAKGRSFRLKPSMRGQFLTIIIRVTKGDVAPRTRTLAYGKVR